jgi:YD repeat-containing protein
MNKGWRFIMFKRDKKEAIHKSMSYEYRYDNENRLIYECIGNGSINEYQYHDVWRDKVVQIVRKKVSDDSKKFISVTETIYYDKKGNKILKVYSDGKKHIWEYDERGNLIKEIYEYD